MPGLIRGVARTAVVAGTATAVSGRVARRQSHAGPSRSRPSPPSRRPPSARPRPPPRGRPDRAAQGARRAPRQRRPHRGRVRGPEGEDPRLRPEDLSRRGRRLSWAACVPLGRPHRGAEEDVALGDRDLRQGERAHHLDQDDHAGDDRRRAVGVDPADLAALLERQRGEAGAEVLDRLHARARDPRPARSRPSPDRGRSPRGSPAFRPPRRLARPAGRETSRAARRRRRRRPRPATRARWSAADRCGCGVRCGARPRAAARC